MSERVLCRPRGAFYERAPAAHASDGKPWGSIECCARESNKGREAVRGTHGTAKLFLRGPLRKGGARARAASGDVDLGAIAHLEHVTAPNFVTRGHRFVRIEECRGETVRASMAGRPHSGELPGVPEGRECTSAPKCGRGTSSPARELLGPRRLKPGPSIMRRYTCTTSRILQTFRGKGVPLVHSQQPPRITVRRRYSAPAVPTVGSREEGVHQGYLLARRPMPELIKLISLKGRVKRWGRVGTGQSDWMNRAGEKSSFPAAAVVCPRHGSLRRLQCSSAECFVPPAR